MKGHVDVRAAYLEREQNSEQPSSETTTTTGSNSALAAKVFAVLSLVALAYAFLAGLRTLTVTDLGWQLATARWIVQHLQIPSTEIFSYTAQGQPWVYPVGSALLFYGAYLVGNYALLSWLQAAACAGTVALLLRIMKFPASWMFGAMIASSVLHGLGYVEGGLPPWVRGVALVGIGALIGARFARVKTRTLLGHVNAGLGSFAIAIAISAIFVTIIVLTTHVRIADIIVAFAPGAMDAMLALALTLHIDPIFVGAHHLSRFVFVTIATPGIVHLFGQPQEDVDD